MAVPRVILSRDSLRYVCDVLLSDLCNRNVFLHVTTAIARLAKVKENSTVLLDLLCDVVVDLSEQSRNKLNILASCLDTIQSKYNQNSESGSLKASSSSNSSSSSRFSTTSAPSKILIGMLPCGEAGGRQHGR